MPVYSYTAKDLSGNLIKGMLNASDPNQLMSLLQEDGAFLLKSKRIEYENSPSRLKPMELADMARQIGNMEGAGLPLYRAIEVLLGYSATPKLKQIYQKILRSLQKGDSLSKAIEEQGYAFPEYFINMVRVAESNGKLAKTAIELAEHYEKEHRLNTKIQGVMTYPLILLVITVLVVLLIFLVVLPNFFETFRNMELPMITKIMIGISNGLVNNWGVVLAMTVLLGFAGYWFLRIAAVRKAIDKAKIKMPKVGILFKTIYTARFARTLSSIYAGGVPLNRAMEISKNTIGNQYVSAQFESVIRSIENGSSLSAALDGFEGFDTKLKPVIYIGEETGRLDTMLASVANSFDYEAEASTQKLVTFLEPIMIVAMALIVGSIMISVLLPILTMYETMG